MIVTSTDAAYFSSVCDEAGVEYAEELMVQFADDARRNFTDAIDVRADLYVEAVSHCLDYVKTGVDGRRRLQAGSSLVVDFYVLCESATTGECDQATEDGLLSKVRAVTSTSAAIQELLAAYGFDGGAVAIGQPYKTQIPVFGSSPPSAPPPPCIDECDTFLDGADKSMEHVCIQYGTTTSDTQCRQINQCGTTGCALCDYGQTLCVQVGAKCDGKQDQKGKWRKKKCAKKVQNKPKKCKKKKFKKKCKLTCCLAD